jgi:hypothetical protein
MWPMLNASQLVQGCNKHGLESVSWFRVVIDVYYNLRNRRDRLLS